MRRLLSSGLVWWLLVCAVGGIWAAPPVQTGTALQYGDTASGMVSETVPCAYFWFEGGAGDAITVEMNRTSGNLDGVLSLYFEDGDNFTAEPLAFNDDRASGGLDPLIETTLPASGWYTLAACRLQYENMRVTEGTFELVLIGLPDAAGGAAASSAGEATPTPPSLTEGVFGSEGTATQAAPTPTVSNNPDDLGSIGGHGAHPTSEPDHLAIEGQLAAGESRLTYPLAVCAGSEVRITLTPGAFPPLVGVLDPDGNLIMQASAPVVTALELTFHPSFDGTVTLVVGHHRAANPAGGDFVLYVDVF